MLGAAEVRGVDPAGNIFHAHADKVHADEHDDGSRHDGRKQSSGKTNTSAQKDFNERAKHGHAEDERKTTHLSTLNGNGNKCETGPLDTEHARADRTQTVDLDKRRHA